MATRRDHYQLSTEISLILENGETIAFTGLDLAFVRQANQINECRLTVQLTVLSNAQTLNGLLEQNLLDLAQLTVPIGTPSHLAASECLTIELVLDPRHHTTLLALGGHDAERVAAFVSRPPARQEPLRLCTSWQARAIYVRHEGARHGYRRAADAPESAPADQTDLADVLNALEALAAYAVTESESLQSRAAEEGLDLLQERGDALDSSPNATVATVLGVLAEDEWQFELQRDPPVFTTAYKGEHGQWECIGYLHDAPAVFVFYSVAWFTVPATRLHAVAEFITRANQELLFGNFELDYASGQIRFRTVAAFDTGPFARDAVRPVLYGNVDSMDHYLPGLMAVSFGARTPSQAIADLPDSASDNLQ